MPGLRGTKGVALETPVLLVCCALVLFLAMAFFRYQVLRERRRTKQRECALCSRLLQLSSVCMASCWTRQLQLTMPARTGLHEPLRLDAAAPLGGLDQISRRKQDLSRFIDRLRHQLAAREAQLRLHDELEEIVTARVGTNHRQDKVRLLCRPLLFFGSLQEWLSRALVCSCVINTMHSVRCSRAGVAQDHESWQEAPRQEVGPIEWRGAVSSVRSCSESFMPHASPSCAATYCRTDVGSLADSVGS